MADDQDKQELQDQADERAQRVERLNEAQAEARESGDSPEDRGKAFRDSVVEGDLTRDRVVVGGSNVEVGDGSADLRDRFEDPEPLGQTSDQPESPNLGSRYHPGSANTTGETDVFDGTPGPPARGE